MLWGSIEAEEGRGSLEQWAVERDDYAGRILGEVSDAFECGRQWGHELTFEQALAYARA